MTFLDPTLSLSTRQEAFCRHYTASGNAADAARRAGNAARSARQTGSALLERPWIVERVRRIRMSWRRTERDEAQIVLARSEQAWDAAVASGSAYMMLRVLRFQAEMAGLVGPAGGNRARLWPVAHEDEFGEIEAGDALEAGTEPGPLADAVRQGHARAERALERHRESREAVEAQEGFDEAAHEEAARRLAAAVEERTRLPVSFGPPPAPANDLPPADDPPEETYEDCPWAGGDSGDEDGIDDDRAEGAETDWLYQRRNGYEDIYDPWAPDEVGERRRSRLEREERGEDDDWSGPATGTRKKKKKKKRKRTGPEDAGFAPDHDKT